VCTVYYTFPGYSLGGHKRHEYLMQEKNPQPERCRPARLQMEPLD